MTDDELQALEALCEAASHEAVAQHGPWPSNGPHVAGTHWRNWPEGSAFIAAANPSVVLELVEEIRQLRQEIETGWSERRTQEWHEFCEDPFFANEGEHVALRDRIANEVHHEQHPSEDHHPFHSCGCLHTAVYVLRLMERAGLATEIDALRQEVRARGEVVETLIDANERLSDLVIAPPKVPKEKGWKRARGRCTYCTKEVALREDGSFVAHNPPPELNGHHFDSTRLCGGSYGSKPREGEGRS